MNKKGTILLSSFARSTMVGAAEPLLAQLECPMIQVRYTGLPSSKTSFDELRPFRERLIRMQGTYRPFSPDYLILSAIVKALDIAAYHFTREPDFFALRPEQSRTLS